MSFSRTFERIFKSWITWAVCTAVFGLPMMFLKFSGYGIVKSTCGMTTDMAILIPQYSVALIVGLFFGVMMALGAVCIVSFLPALSVLVVNLAKYLLSGEKLPSREEVKPVVITLTHDVSTTSSPAWVKMVTHGLKDFGTSSTTVAWSAFIIVCSIAGVLIRSVYLSSSACLGKSSHVENVTWSAALAVLVFFVLPTLAIFYGEDFEVKLARALKKFFTEPDNEKPWIDRNNNPFAAMELVSLDDSSVFDVKSAHTNWDFSARVGIKQCRCRVQSVFALHIDMASFEAHGKFYIESYTDFSDLLFEVFESKYSVNKYRDTLLSIPNLSKYETRDVVYTKIAKAVEAFVKDVEATHGDKIKVLVDEHNAKIEERIAKEAMEAAAKEREAAAKAAEDLAESLDLEPSAEDAA